MLEQTGVENELEEEIEKIKNILNEALASKYIDEKFRGKISTSPYTTSSDISADMMFGMCGTLVSCIQIASADKNVNFDKSTSPREDTSGHAYLTTELRDGSELIIDPTIGQFIKGFNHVFIGTRKELQDLVVNQTGEGKKYQIINTRSRNSPEEAFLRIWGDKRHPLGTQMSNAEHRQSILREKQIVDRQSSSNQF